MNCVCPGLIDIPMTAAMGDDPAAIQWVVDLTPLKRMEKANEIADYCLFLSSTRASWAQG
jgi:NAD(P)-dependent dehydrogenase (short-subunit alcohol dehydrogenase family)